MIKQPKTERIEFRTTLFEKSIFKQAADIVGSSVTDFVVKTAYKAALEIIMNQTERFVTADQWATIEAELSEPPTSIPALREKLIKRGYRARTEEIPMGESLSSPVVSESVSTDETTIISNSEPNVSYGGVSASVESVKAERELAVA